jgi:hypothetical protein
MTFELWALSVHAYRSVITSPLRSALTMAPTELPVSDSTAPFGLVSRSS